LDGERDGGAISRQRRPPALARNETLVHPNQLVGDHTNPILKSDAAEILKTYGELELSGKGHPTAWTEVAGNGALVKFLGLLRLPTSIVTLQEGLLGVLWSVSIAPMGMAHSL